MNGPIKKRQATFFADRAVSTSISQSFMQLAAKKHATKSEHLVSPANQLRVRHGETWTSPGLPEARNAGMKRHSAISQISFEEVLANDLTLIERVSNSIAEDFSRQMAEMVYGFVGEVCNETGNVVTAAPESPLEELVYRALDKVEYVVDRHGKVAYPALHVSPQMYERLKVASSASSTEINARFEALHKRKEQEAIAKETQRRAMFRNYGESE